MQTTPTRPNAAGESECKFGRQPKWSRGERVQIVATLLKVNEKLLEIIVDITKLVYLHGVHRIIHMVV